MKILIDMNLSPLWVQFLVENGIQAIHWSTVGEPTASDSQILDYAASHGLAQIAWPKRDTGADTDVLPAAIGTLVLQAIDAAREYLAAGAIVTVDLAQHRIRLLPV